MVLTRALVTRAVNGKDTHTYLLEDGEWTRSEDHSHTLTCYHPDCSKELGPDTPVYSHTTTTGRRYYCQECYESLWL